MASIASAFQILAALKEFVPSLRFRPSVPDMPSHCVLIAFEFVAGPPDRPQRYGNQIGFSTTADDVEVICALETAATQIHLAYKRAMQPGMSQEELHREVHERLDKLHAMHAPEPTPVLKR